MATASTGKGSRTGASSGAMGSTMVRRQLGRRLRQLRIASGRTLDDVADAKIMSLTKLKTIEYGRQGVRPGDAYELAHLYGVGAEELARLHAMAEATNTPGWWQEYGDNLVKGFETYLDLESVATSLSIYHPSVIHGLVQTREYAQAVDKATAPPDAGPEVIERSVHVRTQRLPALLRRPRPPQIEVVLGEAALRLQVGGFAVMASQREHLLRLAAQEGISITVLLPSRGPSLGLLGPFTILDFDDPDDPSVTFVETYAGARYDDRARPIATHRRVFRDVSDRAVSLEEYFDEQ